MATVHPGNHHIAHHAGQAALERRIAQARQQIAGARVDFHAASRAVAEAERTLCTLRMEREEAALRLARLAEILESLENTLAEEHTLARNVPRQVH